MKIIFQSLGQKLQEQPDIYFMNENWGIENNDLKILLWHNSCINVMLLLLL